METFSSILLSCEVNNQNKKSSYMHILPLLVWQAQTEMLMEARTSKV